MIDAKRLTSAHAIALLAAPFLAASFLAASILASGAAFAGDDGPRTRIVTWGSSVATAATLPTDIPAPILGMAASRSVSYIVDANGRLIVCPLGAPSPLADVPYIAVAAGTDSTGFDHVLALKPDGTVVAAGSNGSGQANVPADLASVVKIAAGPNISGALKSDGSIVLWGSASSLAIPAGPYADFALGKELNSGRIVALRTNGTVVSLNAAPPAGLRNVVEVAAGAAFFAARRGDGSLACWGDNTFGQCNVPAGIGPVISVDAGKNFTVAVRADGSLRAWGSNSQGETRVPTNFGPATRVRCGELHTMVLLADGSVRAFGIDAGSPALAIPRAIGPQPRMAHARGDTTTALCGDGSLLSWGRFGSLPPPEDSIDFDLSEGLSGGGRTFIGRRADLSVWSRYASQQPAALNAAISVTAGADFCAAVRTDGTVFAWGPNIQMSTVPASIGLATRVDAGDGYALAHRTNGTLGSWGAASLAPPSTLGVVTNFSAGLNHALARRTNVLLTGWPTSLTEAQIPADLGPVTAFSAGASTSVAIRADGSVRAWGCTTGGTCQGSVATIVQPTLPPVSSISVSFAHVVAIVDDDCNRNGISDLEELEGHDCDGNGVHDSCDALLGRLEDCNGNGVGDACEKLLSIDRTSEQFTPIGVDAPAAWTIPAAARAATPVAIDVRARGDFGAALEFVTVACGEVELGTAFAAGGECNVILPWRTFTIPANTFNGEIAADGGLTLRATASLAVDPEGCTIDSWLEFRVRYFSATNVDCNANGIVDSCEIESAPGADANRNGILDLCEAPFADCPADFDRDGDVGTSDLSVLLATWGTATTLPGVDIVTDGIIDSADLSVLLQSWGPCSRK
ncbi:MAG: hypothetical protein LW806_08010 [Planctomycetaceae bacterium]|nr:hypothetical protein [Planctomycetaceae bacterium]